MIEQANFTNSPLGKAFEKQIKTIGEQGTKQVKTLENLKSEEQKSIEYESNDKLSIQKQFFNRLIDGRTDEIQEIAKEIDYGKLTYYFKGPHIAQINFFKT